MPDRAGPGNILRILAPAIVGAVVTVIAGLAITSFYQSAGPLALVVVSLVIALAVVLYYAVWFYSAFRSSKPASSAPEAQMKEVQSRVGQIEENARTENEGLKKTVKDQKAELLESRKEIALHLNAIDNYKTIKKQLENDKTKLEQENKRLQKELEKSDFAGGEGVLIATTLVASKKDPRWVDLQLRRGSYEVVATANSPFEFYLLDSRNMRKFFREEEWTADLFRHTNFLREQLQIRAADSWMFLFEPANPKETVEVNLKVMAAGEA